MKKINYGFVKRSVKKVFFTTSGEKYGKIQYVNNH